MIYPLHRLHIFWFGLFGLVFLLWAWADSFDSQTGIALRRGTRVASAFNDGSALYFTAQTFSVPAHRIDLYRNPSLSELRPLLWARPGIERVQYGSGENLRIILPHWLLLLAYLALWLPVLVLRYRRYRRLSPPDPAGQGTARGAAT